MKSFKWILTALVVATPLAVQASCETVKADINQKIINNGVPASGFTLDIVPNDQADQAGGQVVGHCENDTQKIVYKRSGNNDDSSVPTAAGTSQDTSAQ
ncbi:membrane protein [bacteria symbiont BFo1 of Frankliniella occidentalis]|uniref:DUF1161 domain-containing protein n=1 Tax=Erwinia aphidicola TaxID=68334 RepID=A0ABU8DJR1_ERWAP|nr:DUF1161 domain-containing protein [Erwinia aphidicola]KMV70590.1 hypothetical protein AI28_22845 [bacteria symbiont BFo1 of Frankliniella occidentalis]KYP82635.1 membrane protein [bacteria symbiont BFo1 of Frankliniella occidentalis]KYP90099.1 membrane protein [bacteria symbiont BFo1 of Frankliniella occidentalis]MBD1374833.1 DUF1161 domain-containing protein [Erwinia aphidicola]MBD1377386.1 DUF1161 domain-containing protein [Erwinia aphidicola]